MIYFFFLFSRKFILSPTLPIREDMRREVMTRIRENVFDKGVFDSVQTEIGKRITATTYPNFLKSDIYLNYLQQLPQDLSASSGSGENHFIFFVKCGFSQTENLEKFYLVNFIIFFFNFQVQAHRLAAALVAMLTCVILPAVFFPHCSKIPNSKSIPILCL